ncbi:hypothetical protein [Actinokineospora sp. HUAS TT18]|uniref:hypothetical protein n=1 Tax=Actinokineospora sp. HUAS TT18 TaxID=3447451 RepID=UPI003F5263AA
MSAAAAPSPASAAAQPAPPIPTVDPGCSAGTPSPICSLPTMSPPQPAPTGLPLPPTDLPPCPTDVVHPGVPVGCVPATPPTSPAPCAGEGCIPRPGVTTPPTGPGTTQPGQGDGEEECGITAIGGCVTNAINGFFRGIVTSALNPLLELLSRTLLTTPTPEALPRVGELWDNSWQILLVSYSLLIVIAGIVAMGYQTVQTRHSIKELSPRLVVGFLAGALSLWVATKGIQIANAVGPHRP